MKLVGTIALWLFASIGVLYLGVLCFSWIAPADTHLDSAYGICDASVWASQKSPTLENTAGHVVVTCSSGEVTHYLVIAAADEQLIHARENQIIYSKEHSVGSGEPSALEPLGIEWMGSAKVALQIPQGLEQNIGAINGVEVIAGRAEKIAP